MFLIPPQNIQIASDADTKMPPFPSTVKHAYSQRLGIWHHVHYKRAHFYTKHTHGI